MRAAKALILSFPGMFRQHLRLSLQQEKLRENLVDEVLKISLVSHPSSFQESVYKDNDEEKHAAIGEALRVVINRKAFFSYSARMSME